MKYAIVMLSLFSWALVSCKKDNPGLNLKEDKEKPVINAVSPVSSNATYSNGQQIQFKATLTDNRSVKSYRVKIEFDQKRNESNVHATPWYFIQSYKADGTRSAEVTQIIPVAQNALAGPYRMTIFCTDAKDQEADSVTVDINIYNTNDMLDPTFTDNNTGPDADRTLSLSALANNAFTVLDTIEDNDRLTLIRSDAYNNRTEKKLPLLPTEVNLMAQGSTNRYYYEQTLFFPDTGKYTFKLIARDLMNNTGLKVIRFNIVP
ncbi:MAG: DUF4625 domain-containing protein [Bacteroidia bacterium]|nr:DUF4625 domain-containing protein [Bacteroidia bacterium]